MSMTHRPLHGGSRSLLLTLAIATASLHGVQAQAQPTAQQARTYEFDIAAQALAPALVEFAEITGFQLFFDANLTRDLNSPGAHGRLGGEQALQRLLAGSNLTYRFTNPTTITLAVPDNGSALSLGATLVESKQIAESPVGPVDGYVARRSLTGSKTDTALVEIPQSISVVTRQEMDDRGVQNLNDAVRYTAGVRSESAGIDSRADDIRIRGFDAGSWSNSRYLDGLRVPRGGQWTTTQFDTYGLERVEVIKGPAAVLYGQVTPGGMINMVSKRPTAEQRNEALLQAGSHDQYKLALDVGGVLDEQGQWLGRLVGSFNDGNAQVDHTDLSRTFIAPSLTWLASEDTEVTFLAQYQKDDGGSTYQFLPMTGTLRTPHGRIDRDTFLGEPDWNVYDREQWSLGYALGHRINDTLSFRQNLRYSYVDTLYKGAVSFGDTQPDGHTLRRRAVLGDGTAKSITVDNHLQADFATGALDHTTLFGVDYLKVDWEHLRTGTNHPNIAPIDIFDPVYSGVADIAPNLRPQSSYDTTNRQTGIYLQDQIAWENWRVTLGGRYDDFDDNQANRLNGTRTVTKDEAFTWRVGATYLFDNGLAPYFSYSTSFEPAVGETWDGSPFEPTEGKQYEAGIKFQPEGSDSLITLSAFQLEQQNITVADTDPSHNTCLPSLCQRQSGESRIRGVELEGKASLTDGLSLSGGYTYLDAEVTKSTGADKGKRLAQVPRHMASLWADYRFQGGPLAGLSIGAGARYTGGTYGDPENLYHIRGYTLFDASVRYDLERLGIQGTEVALNASNLTDELYVANCSTVASCFYGSGRNVTASLKYHW
ncbi:TonB-dependent siderophore receptor [Zestomonas carbonaria]|uniref:Metal-pseudopaline receptor CntO n=1 Tax=Zestomonas carbonaria TaxID=2762745 RepID=A0A7U7I8Z1_9GAMM|nr:TonB-dependent siderophore receptor [Pseudomonas carbonaria]CAD5107770.1 Ferrichrome outer membrane transporter/phage receptor [Pseudomonas carbonaria]